MYYDRRFVESVKKEPKGYRLPCVKEVVLVVMIISFLLALS